MKISKNNVFIVGLLIVAGSMNAMEVFPFSSLPYDLQKDIRVVILKNEINNLPKTVDSVVIIGKKINDFSLVDKAFNQTVNEPTFCLKLIKNIARGLDLSDTNVAETLKTACAQKRLRLQNQLKDCLSTKNVSISLLNKLLQEGADIEWTYDDGTLLWMAVQNYNENALKVLASRANVNRPTGKTFPTILDYIVMNFGKDLIKMFLSAGADVNKLDPNNRNNEKLQQALAEMGRR